MLQNKNNNKIEALAHLTCLGAKNEIDDILKQLRANNIENILALRGDKPKDSTPIGEGDFNMHKILFLMLKKKRIFNRWSILSRRSPRNK